MGDSVLDIVGVTTSGKITKVLEIRQPLVYSKLPFLILGKYLKE
jgi:hypothetical protein